MIRRPPRSPLFPNTTLSRSHRRHHRGTLEARASRVTDDRHEMVEHRQPVVAELLAPPPELEATLEARVFRARVNAEADRKSTRLNSSHLVISYAVFCLNEQQ